MTIYTKTGDDGTTGLLTGERVPKDSLRVEAYGTIDEVNSALGMARALSEVRDVKDTIFEIQKLLMLVMAELASTKSPGYITNDHVRMLEKIIDKFQNELPPLTKFIIPGEQVGSAALDVARTVVRRGERLVLRLSREVEINQYLLISLNRMSDLFFVLARAENEKNQSQKIPD